MNIRVLIVDDEERWRRIVGDFLRNEGYEVLEAGDGLQALELMRSGQQVDLIVLDLMMPHMDGLETCRQIRKISTVPVMIVTARDEEQNEIGGFDCGADDYIAKPLRFPIFIARVKALLKRTVPTTNLLQAGPIEINRDSHSVTVAGRPINLTPREYELLLFLIQHGNTAMSRQQILSAVWNFEYFGDARTVDTHVKNLRMKLGEHERMLKTIRGSGYLLEF